MGHLQVKQIDHDPKEPSRAALAGVGIVNLVVLFAGMALISYLNKHYAHAVGAWLFSLFGY